MASGEFTEGTKKTLAKRAGERCSMCGVGTSKPHTDNDEFVNLGEAAHIRGRERGKYNRYDENMADEQRSDISNGIWLCSTCHGLVDRDDKKYTVEVLQKQKADHEHKIDTGYYDQKFPDYASEEIIKHDKKIFEESTAIFNESNLNALLHQLKQRRFIYWDDNNFQKLNQYIEFHNLLGKKYLTDALNESWDELRQAFNWLLHTLYLVNENEKQFDPVMQGIGQPYFIGMQEPPGFLPGMLWNPLLYSSYRRKHNSFGREIDRCIEKVSERFGNYRQLIKKTLMI